MAEIRPSYGDHRRTWSGEFVEYMYQVMEHPIYSGMPCTTDDEGKIDWTIPSNRSRGSKNWDGNRRRREWWKQKAAEIGLETKGQWISRVAKTIHPTGRKPCQTCGRIMELAYVYPTRSTVTSLNRHLPPDEQLVYEDLLTVNEVIDHFYTVLGNYEAARALASVFKGLPRAAGADAAKDYLRAEFVQKESRKCSPGAMANPPDRLDGFHTYNLCCRSRQDRGRAKKNLRTYSDDRRAFEHWCEGDWAAANVLMTQAGTGPCAAPGCDRTGMITADHVGPISLGFAHSPHFVPLCGPCNSAKNNRMSLRDVQLLLEREQLGQIVTSWQAQPLWNRTKDLVKNDADALLLSKLFRINQHHYLSHLNEALTAGIPDVLLQLLSPELALQKAEFIGLDPATLTYDRIERRRRNDTYAHSKASRMARIAFDALREYSSKEKRNVQFVDSDHVRETYARYRAALERAKREPSSIREGAVEILASDDSAEVRAAEINRLLAGRYKPDVDYTYVRAALRELMEAYAEVLAGRFERGDAVNWDD
jgi:Alw26I/Eco31I/Esp3I family type II restriction endonuclease